LFLNCFSPFWKKSKFFCGVFHYSLLGTELIITWLRSSKLLCNKRRLNGWERQAARTGSEMGASFFKACQNPRVVLENTLKAVQNPVFDF